MFWKLVRLLGNLRCFGVFFLSKSCGSFNKFNTHFYGVWNLVSFFGNGYFKIWGRNSCVFKERRINSCCSRSRPLLFAWNAQQPNQNTKKCARKWATFQFHQLLTQAFSNLKISFWTFTSLVYWKPSKNQCCIQDYIFLSQNSPQGYFDEKISGTYKPFFTVDTIGDKSHLNSFASFNGATLERIL